MSISVDLDDHIELAKIAARHDDVGYSVGVHPCEDPATMARATTEYLIELAQPEKVWAIGETGLDYFHSTDFIKEQKECFARHIHASQSVKKPFHPEISFVMYRPSTHASISAQTHYQILTNFR